MAIITTKAIVLSSLKYSDSSLIVRCYTQKEGVKSYLIRGILKAKKGSIRVAYFQPLTQLNIIANHNTKNTLNYIKEAQIGVPYKTIYSDVVKQSIVLFLSEVLANCIQEEEENTTLFTYLETALIWLDVHKKIANFHLLFLLNLTRFLGFYPDISEKNKKGFDLMEGNFTNSTHKKNVVSGNHLYQFKKLLGIDFDAIHKVSFNKQERQSILQMIIQYFELHLDGFKTPKSLQILEVVFN
ncbi:MAG: DNA repair protein RecO [Polaribacter sp.]